MANIALEEYRGHAVTVTKGGKFRVIFGDDDDIGEDTLDALHAEVDDRIRAEAKSKPLALRCITHRGHDATITGINLGNRSLTGIPKGDYGSLIVYAPEPWVKDAIQELGNANRAVTVLLGVLGLVEIAAPSGYGRIKDDAYAGHIENLATDYEEATMAANLGRDQLTTRWELAHPRTK